ncbi:SH3 domain-containing protein [Gemmobacter sp.]|uniref:SH3 domain-containing protein n=1 Tax=Gemmobacter sp. TaxID=1898957 RepID=UPI0025BD976E|nr:SH3 domain-containing protein [Gemmobacter sp.]
MCLLAVLLIWGEGPGRQTGAQGPSASAESPRDIPALQSAAYTPAEPASALPLVLPLVTAPEVQATAPEAPMDLRYITAKTVNVREGPSTEYPVIGKLSRGEATRLLWLEENGWARITLEGDGMTGFVSGEFLSADAP